MRKFLCSMLLIFMAALNASAQGPAPAQNVPPNGIPDCQIGPITTATTGRMAIYDNRFTGCTSWTLYEFTNGSAASVGIELDEAPDAGGIPGSWVIWPGANRGASTVAYPISSTAQGQASVFSFFPWVSVNIPTFTGAGANITYLAIGFRPRFNADASASGSTANGGSINVQSTTSFITPATAEANAVSFVSQFAANNGAQIPLAVENFGIDPCQASGVPKSHAFATITTATTTALVAVSGATQVFVCEVDFGITGTTTAGTILFEQGTGVACAASPVSLTATYTDAGASITDIFFSIGKGSATTFKTAASNGLCAVTTVGTAPSIPVDVTFVQQ